MKNVEIIAGNMKNYNKIEFILKSRENEKRSEFSETKRIYIKRNINEVMTWKSVKMKTV